MSKVEVSHIARHERFYVQEGNVVMLALQHTAVDDSTPGSRKTYIAFRLHIPTLTLWSQYFAQSITSSVKNASEEEMYDGAPVVLLPETASEVESLFESSFYHM